MKEALIATERELVLERKQMEDAERRGGLAAAIPDPETVALAERYAAKHRERLQVLERKVVVQRDELMLAEREVSEMTSQLRSAKLGGANADASSGAAWRELESAGGARPGTDVNDELLRSHLDRAAHEAAADAQLEHLKRKMGKTDPKREA